MFPLLYDEDDDDDDVDVDDDVADGLTREPLFAIIISESESDVCLLKLSSKSRIFGVVL